eukprot:GHVU01137883.1.p1 GENE.GHVU01137883.1~~GHVU01137883.1.p1  ORF type:complete len:157 (+),score=26.26 GHVU01137883.1:198-668(+)
MIKELNGMPGLRAERFQEAKTVAHCALSLVGEPVMYPRIRELLEELHRRRISSFLVTNGQFPESLRELPRVTQLYVSIDAPNKEELRAIDRPLFADFWERLRQCLRLMKGSGQRCVYRLTLVKEHNMQVGLVGGLGAVDVARGTSHTIIQMMTAND